MEEGKTYTTIVDRSPYGYGDMEWLTDIFVPFGFVAIGQDMRGTEKSQGNFTMWQSDKWDSEDLGDWITIQQVAVRLIHSCLNLAYIRLFSGAMAKCSLWEHLQTVLDLFK